MKIVVINSVPYGSTGMIARNITDLSKKIGESYFAYSWTKKRKWNTKKDEILIGTFLEKFICLKLEKLTGNIGKFNYIGTYFFIKKLQKIKPDIIHLHNLHEGYINYKMLFKYIKENDIKVFWTLHDCWAFTGHCPHFELSQCYKWKKLCHDCPIYKEYPKSIIDNSKKMYIYKKKIFNMLDQNKMTIITPSKWLAEYVKKSYLNKYKVYTINNGINLDIFKPTNSNVKEKYNLKNKKVLLGVSMDWGVRKGLDIFIKLSNDLGNDYKIILVGTNEQIDKILPNNIISIHRTYSPKELAEIYSAADLFINPTREDNFPTVNIEALACGLPVITFDTGGSPEMIDHNCGRVVKKNDYKELFKTIQDLSNKKIKSSECILKARMYNANDKYNEYVEMFKNCDKNNL